VQLLRLVLCCFYFSASKTSSPIAQDFDVRASVRVSLGGSIVRLVFLQPDQQVCSTFENRVEGLYTNFFTRDTADFHQK